MKALARVIGIDDGFFKPRTKMKTYIVGVVFRVDNRIEGIISEKIKVDALDSTEKIISMISKSKFKPQIKVVLLGGVNFAGFNIIDAEKLYKKLRIPIIIVFRKKPRMEKIRNALKSFKDFDKRIALIKKAGEIHRANNFFFQCHGIEQKEAQVILKKCSYHSNLPEPIRLAHLIASGITLGESTRP